MDGSRFDAWTRRAFGLAFGGAVAVALGLDLPPLATAKKKKRRCKRLRQSCRPGNKRRRCCKKQTLRCGKVFDLSGHRCCRPVRGLCQNANECCGDLNCDQIAGLGLAPRCCSGGDEFCLDNNDCCAGFGCNTADQQCVPV